MSSENPYQPPLTTDKPVNVPEGSPWWLFGSVGIASVIVGVVSRHVRPMIEGPVHYEAIVALCLEIAMILVAVFVLRRRTPRNAITNLNLVIGVIWSLFFVGWTVRHGGIWNDFLGLTMMFWLLSAAVGSLIILVLTRQNSLPG